MLTKTEIILSRLQEMKQRSEEIRQRLENTVLKTEGAGGDIKVEINGNRKIKSIEISSVLQHGNKEELWNQLAVTINNAIATADKVNSGEMKKAAGSLMSNR